MSVVEDAVIVAGGLGSRMLPTSAYLPKEALQAKVREARKNMEKAAMDMDFIQAAHFRDEIERMQNQLKTLA